MFIFCYLKQNHLNGLCSALIIHLVFGKILRSSMFIRYIVLNVTSPIDLYYILWIYNINITSTELHSNTYRVIHWLLGTGTFVKRIFWGGLKRKVCSHSHIFGLGFTYFMRTIVTGPFQFPPECFWEYFACCRRCTSMLHGHKQIEHLT